MRLADFILANVEPILAEWEAFARRIWTGQPAEPAELRDHAEAILHAIANDMQSSQTPIERAEKSKGGAEASERNHRMCEASDQHATARVGSGFTITAVVAEYRALRASVLRLWRDSNPQPDQRDLDDLTRFNESIDESIAEAVRSFTERVSRARQMFLAILGHDLRNPLSAMKLTGHMLAHSGQLDADLTQLASQIPVNAAAMTDLIDDLLDFSGSVLSGGLPVEPAPMDLAALCKQVLGELRVAHPQRVVQFNARGDCAGTWDAARLRQVVSNLLGNAIFHDGSEAAGKTPGQIHLSVTDEGSEVTLAVHNTGTPIPPEALATIFDPLVRGPYAPKHKGSMGLGLYITRAAVLAHGGRIDVTSSAQTGTTFTVKLPRQRTTH